MYDYYLGGSTNYEADRQAAEKALSVVPSGRRIARANRYFMMRAVVLMADQGIRQFIDLGTGIPTSPSVHELAQAIQPGARVLYVDNDDVVMAHSSALLTASQHVRVLRADIREPETILGNPEVQGFIDLSQPVGVLSVAVLHFVRDRENPVGIVRTFTDRMVPGSYLALSHITSDRMEPGVIATIHEAYAEASAPAVFRTKAEILGFFSGLDMVHPGLVDVTRWFPYAAVFASEPPALRFLAGLGRKPLLVRSRPARLELPRARAAPDADGSTAA
jgi:hypothetical protein